MIVGGTRPQVSDDGGLSERTFAGRPCHCIRPATALERFAHDRLGGERGRSRQVDQGRGRIPGGGARAPAQQFVSPERAALARRLPTADRACRFPTPTSAGSDQLRSRVRTGTACPARDGAMGIRGRAVLVAHAIWGDTAAQAVTPGPLELHDIPAGLVQGALKWSARWSDLESRRPGCGMRTGRVLVGSRRAGCGVPTLRLVVLGRVLVVGPGRVLAGSPPTVPGPMGPSTGGRGRGRGRGRDWASPLEGA